MKLVNDCKELAGQYDTYTRDELLALMDESIASLPEISRASASFSVIVMTYPYDSADYPRFCMTYQRPETEIEEKKRLADEEKGRIRQEESERAAYERLKAKFNPTS